MRIIFIENQFINLSSVSNGNAKYKNHSSFVELKIIDRGKEK